jgi:hypothetical protein
MPSMSSSTPDSADQRKRERRTYNRRQAATPETPPYFSVFERIAVALENIAAELGSGKTVVLPRDEIARER